MCARRKFTREIGALPYRCSKKHKFTEKTVVVEELYPKHQNQKKINMAPQQNKKDRAINDS